MLNRVRAGLYKQPFTAHIHTYCHVCGPWEDPEEPARTHADTAKACKRHTCGVTNILSTEWCIFMSFLHTCYKNKTFNHCGTETAEVFRESAPTFADVLVLQPQLPLDLFVRVPDGARLLETIHRLLYKVVPEVPQNGDKVAPLSRPVQRMNS